MAKEKLTLEQLEQFPGEVLTCAQVAPLIGANQHTLHLKAMEAPYMLGFPVIRVGNRVKIPKRPFVTFMREGHT